MFLDEIFGLFGVQGLKSLNMEPKEISEQLLHTTMMSYSTTRAFTHSNPFNNSFQIGFDD